VSRVSTTMFPVRKVKRKEDLTVSMIWAGSILSSGNRLLLFLCYGLVFTAVLKTFQLLM
jgi:predicted membrane chloride channel (bestrophin family)